MYAKLVPEKGTIWKCPCCPIETISAWIFAVKKLTNFLQFTDITERITICVKLIMPDPPFQAMFCGLRLVIVGFCDVGFWVSHFWGLRVGGLKGCGYEYLKFAECKGAWRCHLLLHVVYMPWICINQNNYIGPIGPTCSQCSGWMMREENSCVCSHHFGCTTSMQFVGSLLFYTEICFQLLTMVKFIC